MEILHRPFKTHVEDKLFHFFSSCRTLMLTMKLSPNLAEIGKLFSHKKLQGQAERKTLVWRVGTPHFSILVLFLHGLMNLSKKLLKLLLPPKPNETD